MNRTALAAAMIPFSMFAFSACGEDDDCLVDEGNTSCVDEDKNNNDPDLDFGDDK